MPQHTVRKTPSDPTTKNALTLKSKFSSNVSEHVETGSSSMGIFSDMMHNVHKKPRLSENSSIDSTQFVTDFLLQSVDSCKRETIPGDEEMLHFIQTKVSTMGHLDNKTIETFMSENEAIWVSMQKEAWKIFSPTTRMSMSCFSTSDIPSQPSTSHESGTKGKHTQAAGLSGVRVRGPPRTLQERYNELEAAYKELAAAYKELETKSTQNARGAYDLNIAASKILQFVHHAVEETNIIAHMKVVSNLTTEEVEDDVE